MPRGILIIKILYGVKYCAFKKLLKSQVFLPLGSYSWDTELFERATSIANY
jgi:hypothetical protein